jgi:hypothetical protein
MFVDHLILSMSGWICYSPAKMRYIFELSGNLSVNLVLWCSWLSLLSNMDELQLCTGGPEFEPQWNQFFLHYVHVLFASGNALISVL